jgi:hypothetical protein
MTMSDMQPRTATGQFSEKEGSAPEIGLNEFGDASFEYPPASYTNAEQVIRFWKSVPVPSSALDAMRVSYAIARTRYIESGADAAGQALYDMNPDWEVQQEANPAAWITKVDSARASGAQSAEQQWAASYEPEIPRHEAREVARALQMWYYADLTGSDIEAAKVRQSPVTIGGAQGTVETVRARYAFCTDAGFDQSGFEPYDSRILAELEQLREDLRDFRQTDEFDSFMAERDARIAQRDSESHGRRR